MSTRFEIGDYVISDHGQFDTFEGVTWKIVDGTRNALGMPCLRVVNIARPDQSSTLFYPHELSWEDGTRPSDWTVPASVTR